MASSKKNSRIIPIILIGAAAYFLFKTIGKAFNNIPNNLQVGRVRIKKPKLSLPNITLPTDIEIVNYNSIPLSVDALYTNLVYKGKIIGTANFIQKVNIPALKSATLPVNIKVSLLSLGSEIASAISAGGNVLDILKRFLGTVDVTGYVYSGGIQFPINVPVEFS